MKNKKKSAKAGNAERASKENNVMNGHKCLDVSGATGNNATKEETHKCYFCGKVATRQNNGYYLCGKCEEKLAAMMNDVLQQANNLDLDKYDTPVK